MGDARVEEEDVGELEFTRVLPLLSQGNQHRATALGYGDGVRVYYCLQGGLFRVSLMVSGRGG